MICLVYLLLFCWDAKAKLTSEFPLVLFLCNANNFYHVTGSVQGVLRSNMHKEAVACTAFPGP